MLIEIIGIFFIIFLGTLCHFVYKWTNYNKFWGILCAANESTWEHLKLAIGPMFLWLIIELPFIGNLPNFLLAKALSILAVLIFIPGFFYLYQFIFKKDIFLLDILDFILAIIFGQYISILILKTKNIPFIYNNFSLIFLIIIFGCYLLLTVNPQQNFLFQDPITKKYGFEATKKEKYSLH